MHPLLQELLARGPVVTDGAWGTQLQVRGLEVGDFPDAWNLSQPEKVAEVARAYVEAGSQVILTNTFGANRIRLGEYQLADRVAEINRRGVEISRSAATPKGVLVFASMGPTGKMLVTGDVTADQLFEVFAEQAQALAAAGADAMVVETMSDPAEAEQAVRAAKSTGLPVVACMVFDSGKQKDRTLMGQTPEQVAQAMTAAGADVVGANCGQGVAGFVSIAQRLHASTHAPIWIKANAGLPEVVTGKTVYSTTPQFFASHARALVDAGASFLGGCCGTTPEFVRALRQQVALVVG